MNHIYKDHKAFQYWECVACDEMEKFADVESVMVHFKEQHKDTISDDQIPTLIAAGSQTAPPAIKSCPLCTWAEDQESSPESHLLLDHIAEHVHSFSLRSLPWASTKEEVDKASFCNSVEKVQLWFQGWPTSEQGNDHHPTFQGQRPAEETDDYFRQNDYFAEISDRSSFAQKPLVSEEGLYGSPSLSETSSHESSQSYIDLEAAILKGDGEAVRQLIEAGEDVNAEMHGVYGSALWAAIASMEKGDVAIIKMLLDKGADTNIQGGEDGNPLAFAADKGEEKLLSELISHGADVNVASGRYGNALMTASYKGHKEIVRLLLANGAEFKAQSGSFRNALEAARHGGHEEVAELLSAARRGTNEKLFELLSASKSTLQLTSSGFKAYELVGICSVRPMI